MTKLVVIGGNAAGMSPAAQVNRRAPDLDIVVLERGLYTSFAGAGLPYFVSGAVPSSANLVVRTPQEHRARGIDVRTGHEAIAVDPAARTVRVRAGDGHDYDEAFDQLVIATGAAPIRPPIPGIDAYGVTVVHTIPDAERLDEWIRTRSPRHAVVVGGGYTGLEMVEALLDRGLAVTLVEKRDQPLASLDVDMADRVSTGLADLGVDTRFGTSATGFDTEPKGWVRAVSTDAGDIPADLVVIALGVRPNTRLAVDAGIAIGPSGAIATDAHLATNLDGIWAAGDCAESLHRVSGKPVWVGLGTHANQHGRVVGLNIAGIPAEFPGVIATAITKVGPVEVGRTGLGEDQARAAGFEPVTRTVEGDTRADYFPGTAKIAVKIIAERGTKRMLGAQIVGGPGSAKRIDALAIAVWNAMTVDEFAQTDLGYAPPYSPVLDPSLIAARLTGDAARSS